VQAFVMSFGTSMKKYKTDVNVKEVIDQLQYNYQCCGAGNYSDWFETPWTSHDYIVDNKPEFIP
jgi:hypothetical protein